MNTAYGPVQVSEGQAFGAQNMLLDCGRYASYRPCATRNPCNVQLQGFGFYGSGPGSPQSGQAAGVPGYGRTPGFSADMGAPGASTSYPATMGGTSAYGLPAPSAQDCCEDE